MDLATEKGASSWLTTRPIEDLGFALHKGAFKDALALRYGWHPTRAPSNCTCGVTFTVEHALSCPRGGFPILRHNELRDVTASLLTEVCHEVSIEPNLQPITGESFNGASAITQDGARLDVSMCGFWGGRHQKTFCDVRVFNPHAPSNRAPNMATTYRKHEREKKNTYEQRVLQIEHASFTPLVFSASGGFGNSASTFYKRLASLLATKRNEVYSQTMACLRCRISFALLRSSIRCIRGARSHRGAAARPVPPAQLSPVMEPEKATKFRFQEEQKTLLTQYWERGMQCCSKSVSAMIDECAIAAKCSVEQVKVRPEEE